MKPYPYQQEGIDEILKDFKDNDRLCYSLATGGGKTALFSFLSKQFIGNSNKRILILAHRGELISQTVNTLYNIGVRSEAVTAKKKYLNHSAQVYVAMVETLSKRMTKNPYFLPDIDLIIVDECHMLVFLKIFDHFPKAKILGVTATPATVLTEKSIRLLPDGSEMEYTQKFGLHKIYNKIILGRKIEDLINDGNLVPEMLFCENSINRNDLTIDNKTNDFKPANNKAEKMCVVRNYEKFSKGKKTIIFTASTKDNLSLLEDFQSRGYENVRIFDSVNKEESGNRADLLKWYKVTPDAILINTGVFTTGFDEPTIESVILAMSTASLSKFHQMVGRGGRSTKAIFKDKFLLLDLGGNVAAFGKWSDHVDWEKHFYLEIKPVPKKEALDNVTNCKECDSLIPSTATICPFCGAEKEKIEKKVGLQTVHVSELIYPEGAKIVKYCELYNKDKNFAVDIMIKQAIELFIYTEVTLATVEETIKNGNFFKTMRRILDEQILVIQNSELSGEYKKNHISELITKLYEVL
jgi:superfamily II DNA or RNA helicase/RNA polymerase subunit RPABC4/transcription elongation factor Spt4